MSQKFELYKFNYNREKIKKEIKSGKIFKEIDIKINSLKTNGFLTIKSSIISKILLVFGKRENGFNDYDNKEIIEVLEIFKKFVGVFGNEIILMDSNWEKELFELINFVEKDISKFETIILKYFGYDYLAFFKENYLKLKFYLRNGEKVLKFNLL